MPNRDLEQDLAKMFAMVAERTERIASAAAVIDRNDPISELSRLLHPCTLNLKVAEIKEETEMARTYRLINPDGKTPLPYFRAGQYISLKPVVDQVEITRPYSISSAPCQAGSFYEITVNRKPGGFFSEHLWENWKVGTGVTADGPHGNFYHEPLRDKNKVVALAGGSGITPFRSIILEALRGKGGPQILLLYGSRHENEIIYQDELQMLAAQHADKFKMVNVISEPSPGYRGLTGLISADLIGELVADPAAYSYFICGPAALHEHCLNELAAFKLPPRLIRRELSDPGESVFHNSDYPGEKTAQEVTVTYTCRASEGTLKANTEEALLVAFERAGLAPQSRCRSGECGFCRTLLLSGEVHTLKDNDGRRAADLKYNYIHPCASFPLTDLEVTF